MKLYSCLIGAFLAAMVPALCAAQTPPRDPRPADLERAAAEAADGAERELEMRIAASPQDVNLRLQLARMQEARGNYELAGNTLLAAAQLEPAQPEGFYRVGVFYWEKAFRDHRLPKEQKRNCIQNGIRAIDTALRLDPDYVEALTYKNILLRMLANESSDREEQKALFAEADALRARSIELNKEGPQRQVDPRSPGLPQAPPPPQPVRVGSTIRVPTKVHDVRPVYPADAMAARVQGVVICEIVIDTTGHVSDVKVLRSIELLDAAAVEAVRQWEFEPTWLNGMPVPVIMTVTVNFTLQQE